MLSIKTKRNIQKRTPKKKTKINMITLRVRMYALFLKISLMDR